MKPRYHTTSNDHYEQAAAWHLKLRDSVVDDTLRAEFERWRAQPEHAAAYRAVERSWHVTGQLPRQGDAAARQHLGDLLEDARAQRGFSQHSRTALAAAGAAAVFALGVVIWLTGLPTEAPGNAANTPAGADGRVHYVTAVGERSTLTLDDGSQVALNTNSRLTVEFSAGIRRVALEDGQALFDVAHDPARPFVVSAGNHQVVALGTSFDVRLDPGSVQVTLIEGSVRVEDSATGGDQPTRLDPGQQFVSAGPQPPEVRPVRIDQVTSWRDGRLIFSDEPLGRAVTEVNRYSTRKVVLADQGLAELRISGVFRTGRPDSFVEAVTSYFSIASRPSPDGDLVLRATDG